ncbi:uncharacterized protein LOC143019751 [Oratosquilla oratoria]|uniref:uncharacterized protein LOC143019751 n=1 Tax=Oratosquilla oratoria TaxID=337810 RepID=UPI003F76A9AC
MTTMEITQESMDQKNFTLRYIRKFDRIYGPTWMSAGGEFQTRKFLTMLGLVQGQRVLILGSGGGGEAFLMAQCYGVHVHGVDISSNMCQVAMDNLALKEKKVQDLIHFEAADMTKMKLEEESYDVIYSRDTILYVRDKESFFKKLLGWLRPGGKLFVADFCRKNKEDSPQELEDLIKLRRWSLTALVDYEEMLRKVGFKDVRAQDISDEFLRFVTEYCKNLMGMRECYIQDFSEEDYDESLFTLKSLQGAVQGGGLAQGLFEASK